MDLLREELDDSDWIDGIRVTAEILLRGLEVSGIFEPYRSHVKPLLSLKWNVLCHLTPGRDWRLPLGVNFKRRGCVKNRELYPDERRRVLDCGNRCLPTAWDRFRPVGPVGCSHE